MSFPLSMTGNWQTLVDKMKRSGRYHEKPAYTASEIDQWQSTHSMKIPDSFRGILSSGSYDVANFYFHPLKEVTEFPGYVLFATWNDDEFAFKLDDPNEDDRPVYVLLSGSAPLRKYDSFIDWFAHICDLTHQSNNPE